MRNYWSLLPAIAVCVVLILLYAIPTLINPQWTSTILGLFRQQPDDSTDQGPHRPAGAGPAVGARGTAASTSAATPGTSGASSGTGGSGTGAAAAPDPDNGAGEVIGPRQIRSRRMLAGMLVLAALALVGFNVSLNREANGCYKAAKAFGAKDSPRTSKDPCIHMIFGEFFGGAGNDNISAATQQPVPVYQPVDSKRPKYLTWIQNRPKREGLSFLIGVGLTCEGDLRVKEEDDKVIVLLDTTAPCPQQDGISLTAVKLKKPLGDRKLVTVGDKPMEAIHPDMDSWPTVLKKLATGG